MSAQPSAAARPGASYPVAGDDVFVMRGRSDAGGNEFDDQLVWLSANALYRHMIEAGRLP